MFENKFHKLKKVKDKCFLITINSLRKRSGSDKRIPKTDAKKKKDKINKNI